jgi:competence protein ComGC
MLKREQGFTLIEMLIVLMIMTTILMIAVPSLTKHNELVTLKGCEATLSLVKAQAESYAIEHNGTLPTNINDLQGYISGFDGSKPLTCPGGENITISSDGTIQTQ